MARQNTSLILSASKGNLEPKHWNIPHNSNYLQPKQQWVGQHSYKYTNSLLDGFQSEFLCQKWLASPRWISFAGRSQREEGQMSSACKEWGASCTSICALAEHFRGSFTTLLQTFRKSNRFRNHLKQYFRVFLSYSACPPYTNLWNRTFTPMPHKNS